ncbi:hypothetical protein PENSPDRAFT_747748 [Peniophora sp. CONT]|nr:hypothetical protein PENSPDRAFT_747748 [Peniophora sp. CONT]
MSDPSHESAWFPEITRRLIDLNTPMITGRPLRDSSFDSELDHEIRSLEHATVQLKRLRNAQKPLLRLPPEVLASIAECLLDEWPAFESPDNEGTTEYDSDADDIVYRPNPHADKRLLLGWVLLSHVCHTLRDMLLSRHVFWAGIVCKSVKARDVILERCGDTPLDLAVDSPRFYHLQRAREALQFIFEHLARAHTIRVNTSSQNSVAFFDPAKLLQNAMPHLTKLYISLSYDSKRVRLLGPEVLELPTLDAPQLTRLHLTNFLVPFSPSNLVKLTLEFHERYNSISADYIMGVLRRSDRLESLTVENCLPMLPAPEAASHAQLPRLQSVFLTDESRHVIACWMYIRAYRPSACFILEFDDVRTRPHTNDAAIPAPLQGNVPGPITGLCIHDREHSSSFGHDYWDDELDSMSEYDLSFFASREGATFRDWRYGRGNDVFRSGFDRRLSTTFKRFSKTSPFAVLSGLAPVIDLGALTTLSLDTAALNFSSEQWTDVLRPMIELQTLFLRSGTKSIAKALTPASKTTDPGPLLPRLHLLWLHALVFAKGTTAEDVPHQGLATYTRMLQARTRRGVSVQHLRIDKLQMEPDMAEDVFIPRMKVLVPLVQCLKVVPLKSAGSITFTRTNVMEEYSSDSEVSDDE